MAYIEQRALLSVEALTGNATAVRPQKVNVRGQDFVRAFERVPILGRISRKPHVCAGGARVDAV